MKNDLISLKKLFSFSKYWNFCISAFPLFPPFPQFSCQPLAYGLSTGKFFPFRKSNYQPLYINAKSNHPPTILRDLPNKTNKRLTEYEKAKPLHETALNESDYKTTMTYTKISKQQKQSSQYCMLQSTL